MTVQTKEQAWEIVNNQLFPTDYEEDHESSIRAGYKIYRHPTLNYSNHISDLNTRLEVTVNNVTTNIWIEEAQPDKIIEVRTLDIYDLMDLCIKNNWYTRGCTAAYSNMLKICDKDNVTTHDIVTAAKDIKDHSNTEESFRNMCFEIANICHIFFEEVE